MDTKTNVPGLLQILILLIAASPQYQTLKVIVPIQFTSCGDFAESLLNHQYNMDETKDTIIIKTANLEMSKTDCRVEMYQHRGNQSINPFIFF